MVSAKPMRDVWSFPRPPALNRVSKRLRVVAPDGSVLADTTNAYEVLETSHPPTYYLPPEDCRMDLLKVNTRSSFCEWKGTATYYDFVPSGGGARVGSRIWTYRSPTPSFTPIKDYLSFYASPWTCYVDDEEVQAQAGDFYGGWITSDITFPAGRGIKGGPGTSHW